jgi:hypothetical protein
MRLAECDIVSQRASLKTHVAWMSVLWVGFRRFGRKDDYPSH